MPLYRAELRRRTGLLPPVLIHDLSQVLYLPFDHDDGDKARDRSGHKNHGTLYGPARVAGKVADALSFDGENDYVDVPTSPSLVSFTQFSIAAWIKMPDHTDTQAYVIARKAANDYLAQIMPDGKALVGANLIGTGFVSVLGNTVVDDDVWHHVAGVYDGVDLRVYVEGSLDKTPVSATGTVLDSNRPLGIGDYFPYPSEPAKGIIDELRIYNRALSAAEIQRVMNMRGI